MKSLFVMPISLLSCFLFRFDLARHTIYDEVAIQ